MLDQVLTRQCADDSNLMYTLRIKCDVLDHDLLAAFDGQMRASLCRDLPDHNWWQATTGVAFGGLGFRIALSVALSAFVASRITSKSLVRTIVEIFCAALLPLHTIMSAYDTCTDEALATLAPSLLSMDAVDLVAQLRGAAAPVEKCARSHRGCIARSLSATPRARAGREGIH